jgi:NAD(P)-dependent dehydrogenase (short-subunit alcohol dehydrogenase family)
MLDKAVKELGKNNVTGVQGDAGSLADLDRLFEIVKKEKGHIDVLFASAGIGELNNPLGSITEKGFDIRLTSTFVAHCLPCKRLSRL